MKVDSSDSVDAEDIAAMSRAEVLALLEEAIDEAHRKAVDGRVYDVENEKCRQGWLRVLGYLVGQHRQVRNDADLVHLQEQLDELQAERDADGGPPVVPRGGGR